MAAVPPTGPRVEPDEPSNRWPWVALVAGLLIVLIAVGYFFYNQSRGVNITVEGTPTPNPARTGTASPGPPPTLVPPALPTSAALAPTNTPLPVPTKPAPPTPTQAAPTPPPPPAPTQPPSATSAAPPSPTPFAGQVANAGGEGNTRADFDAAYGPPTGETPEHLVVYRKNMFEYRVRFVPDINGRAALIVEQPQQSSQPLTLQQAQAEARKLLPKDAQPPNPTPEGNDQFVVERYTSQTLAQALPSDVFTANNGQPGQFLVVYVKDPQGRIARIIVGPGNDPNALFNQAR